MNFWDVATGRKVKSIADLTGNAVADLAFSPDGRTVIVQYSRDQFFVDWRSGRRTRLATSIQAEQAVFRPDGRVLAISDGRVSRLIDVSSGAEIGIPFGAAEQARVRGFSPDGRLVVTSSPTNAVSFWDAATQRHRPPILRGHTREVTTIAFSPRGDLLATGSGDGTVRLWDVRTQRPLGGAFIGLVGYVTAMEFDSDGTFLSVVGEEGTFHQLMIDPEVIVAEICRRAGRTLSQEEWARHIPEVPFRKVCPA
jgi:WD40 repeat protein